MITGLVISVPCTVPLLCGVQIATTLAVARMSHFAILTTDPVSALLVTTATAVNFPAKTANMAQIAWQRATAWRRTQKSLVCVTRKRGNVTVRKGSQGKVARGLANRGLGDSNVLQSVHAITVTCAIT